MITMKVFDSQDDRVQRDRSPRILQQHPVVLQPNTPDSITKKHQCHCQAFYSTSTSG